MFEITCEKRDGKPPLVYEVSGPYEASSRQYATRARMFEDGHQVFEAEIKSGILIRTGAMAALALQVLEHRPKSVLIVGTGALSVETCRRLK